MKITRRSIRTLVDRAESDFQFCWNLLSDIGSGKNADLGRSVLEFQPRLASVLFALTRSYRMVIQEQRAWVRRRSEIDAQWFVSRMRFLGSQKDILNRAISMGKGIGDAFAWLFYQNDRELMTDHMACDRIVHPPPGVGGLAELHSAKTIAFYNGHFIVHHCVTGLLRIGDLTLIDRDTARVAGIGEIKATSPRPDQIQVNILLSKRGSSEQLRANGDLESAGTARIRNLLTPAEKARFDRQLAKVKSCLSPDPTPSTSLGSVETTDKFAKRLDSFVIGLKPNKPACCRIGPGLVVLGYRAKHQKLYSRLKNERSCVARSLVASDIEMQVKEILIPDRKDINALQISCFYYDESGVSSLMPGMTHLMWWPLHRETVHKIVFQEVSLVAVFNPAHLCLALEQRGFRVAWMKNGDLDITKEVVGKLFQVHGSDYFMKLVSHYLMSEESVADILTRTHEKATERDSESATIQVNVQQMFG